MNNIPIIWLLFVVKNLIIHDRQIHLSRRGSFFKRILELNFLLTFQSIAIGIKRWQAIDGSFSFLFASERKGFLKKFGELVIQWPGRGINSWNGFNGSVQSQRCRIKASLFERTGSREGKQFAKMMKNRSVKMSWRATIPTQNWKTGTMESEDDSFAEP